MLHLSQVAMPGSGCFLSSHAPCRVSVHQPYSHSLAQHNDHLALPDTPLVSLDLTAWWCSTRPSSTPCGPRRHSARQGTASCCASARSSSPPCALSCRHALDSYKP